MRKYITIGSVAVFVLVAVSVFALQGKSVPSQVAQEVQPNAASTSYSGCGANGSCCGSTAGCGGESGGCGGEAVEPSEAKARADQIVAYLQDYYTSKMGYESVQVKVDDFGCHQEATVSSGSEVVDRLSISGTRITRIEG